MLTAKEKLEGYLEDIILKITTETDLCNQICDYAKEHYSIPRGITSDYLTFRASLEEASEFILFCLLDSITKITDKGSSVIHRYYNEQEIKTYQNARFEVDKIKFPLKFKVVQIADDQWIGKIDFDMLMKLRSAQLINYNENAQRTMQKIIKGGKEVWKIALNKNAVKEIESMYERGIYIPTPFTLNIQEDDSKFYYDEENCTLVVKSIKAFDIADGYHRYVAACRVTDRIPGFNYTMELRIVNFSEEKAKQFIFQENQKTKMKKVDSDAMNTYKSSNTVAKRLNDSYQSNIQGLIGMNQSVINMADLSGLIHYFYFKGYTRKIEEEKEVMVNVTKELTENFNMLTEYDTRFLKGPYSYKQLTAIMCVFNYFHGKDKKKMCEIIPAVIEKTEQMDNKRFADRTPKKLVMNAIEKIIYKET